MTERYGINVQGFADALREVYRRVFKYPPFLDPARNWQMILEPICNEIVDEYCDRGKLAGLRRRSAKLSADRTVLFVLLEYSSSNDVCIALPLDDVLHDREDCIHALLRTLRAELDKLEGHA